MKAWNLVGSLEWTTTHYARIKGGRTLYEHAAPVNSHDGSQNVRLARLDNTKSRLHQVSRNIPWDTEVELVPIKVYVCMVRHYDQQPQKAKAFHDKDNARRFNAQQAEIMKGYNYSVWKEPNGEWYIYNTKKDRLETVYWIQTADKADVLDLF